MSAAHRRRAAWNPPRGRVAAAPAVFALAALAGGAQDEPAAFFERRIRPLFAESCYECHTAASGASGGLRVDSRAGLLAGGDSGPALVPGDPEASLMIAALRRTDPERAMPPEDPLPRAAVADVYAWIEAGAYWPEQAAKTESDGRWWSFQPVRDSVPPAVPGAEVANAIDAFVLARLFAEGLAPVGMADRRTLLRRASFDLTGLPPAPAELARFLADDAPNAWSAAVERLLASRAYGERQGRHWLDVARYADTAGDSSDYPIPDAWRYRNWVIDAFNADKPYDEFLREQIAGDLYAGESPAEAFAGQTVATGFLALARRFGVAKDGDRHLTIEDTIDTLGRATMGLTLSCARCHDHKFDPISMEDYYGLYGIFDSTVFPFPGSENERRPDRLTPLAPPAERDAALAAHAGALADLEERLARARLASFQAETEASAAREAAEELSATLTALRAGVSIAFDADPWRDAFEFSLPVGGTFAVTLQSALAERVPFVRWNGAAAALEWRWGADARTPSAWSAHGTRVLEAGAQVVQLAGDRALTAPPLALRPEFVLLAPVLVPEAEWRLAEARLAEARRVADERRALAIERDAERARIEAEREEREQRAPRFETAYAVYDGIPHDVPLQLGGRPNRRGDVVPRAFPAAVRGAEPPPLGNDESGRRALADWLTDPEHPLTARVMVNRVWQHLFGTGLVTTPSNFGREGEPPSHPELLDWLARRFVEEGWSVKALHRLILSSATYRRASTPSAAAAAVDPRRRLLWGHARRRLAAEELRDAILTASGTLDPTPGEAHPFPGRAAWNWTQHDPFRTLYPSLRRAVYLMTPRLRRHPFLALFDGPDTNASSATRFATTVPSQALYLMNDPFVHAAAEAFARRVLAEESDEDRRLSLAVRLAFAREPRDGERDALRRWLAGYRAELAREGTPEGAAEAAAWAGLARALFSANEFLYVD